MRYQCDPELHADLRAAVATLSARTRRWGVDHPGTVEARNEYNRLRTLALIQTAEQTYEYLTSSDRERYAARLRNAEVVGNE